MKLSDCEVLPGIIINVADPEKRGRVKASVPTWFDTSVMDEEALPWIEPGPTSGYQRFSKMECGTKIYVFRNTKNNDEYYYLCMPNMNTDTDNAIGDYASSEVLLSRSTGQSGSVFVYYNDKEGLVSKLGDTKIQITPNKEINITDNKSSLNIVDGIITIGGNDKDKEYTVMGQTLQKLLTDLGGDLQNIGKTMSSMPFVSPLGEEFTNMGTDIQKKCADLLSNTVKISK